MAFSILSLLILAVVVGAVVIGVAFLVFLFINRGGPNKIPDEPVVEDGGTRPSASQQSGIGCILGIISVFILGMLLAIGIVLSLFLGRETRSPGNEQNIQDQVEQLEQSSRSIDASSTDSATVDSVPVVPKAPEDSSPEPPAGE